VQPAAFGEASMNSSASPLVFPCDFPIKAFGSGDDFVELVIELIGQHAPGLDTRGVRVQDSRNGRYRAVTVVVHAQSRPQLDAIYSSLSAHERVVMAL